MFTNREELMFLYILLLAAALLLSCVLLSTDALVCKSIYKLFPMLILWQNNYLLGLPVPFRVKILKNEDRYAQLRIQPNFLTPQTLKSVQNCGRSLVRKNGLAFYIYR